MSTDWRVFTAFGVSSDFEVSKDFSSSVPFLPGSHRYPQKRFPVVLHGKSHTGRRSAV